MAINRRTFVLAAGSGAAATRLSVPAVARAKAGSIDDIRHVVILMQENRSFDHYYGTLRGVRGFGDPRPARIPGGDPIWAQPRPAKDGGGTVWPFHLDTQRTAAGCAGSLNHDWKGTQHLWRNWDVWIPEKTPMTMGYMTRADLPYYYALADAFTICDAYHCSIQGPTGPNRLYHFAGSNGLSVGFDGIYAVTNGGCDDNPGADMAKDDPKFAGLAWIPYAERLERAGISWRVYQEYANYSDNSLGYFKQFRNLDRSSSRYNRARAWVQGSTPENAEQSRGRHLIEAFAADVAADRLPAVSWIVPQMQMSEHPDGPPLYGQHLTGSLIAALAANPEVWAKTVFILNYDEHDGLFDHMVPPTAATRPEFGASTVDLRGEDYKGEPVGLGPRVPLTIVSPWTRGGWVNSQLFDHTSVLRFLEKRFGIAEPNISPWRREVCGDLTSAFDFDRTPEARRDTGWFRDLPDVSGYIAASDAACRQEKAVAKTVPATVPVPEPGTRPSRALPYDFDVAASWTAEGATLRFVNSGRTGVVFQVQDEIGFPGWRHYTVGAGKTLDAVWPIAADAPFALVVSGPNGFHRAYRGKGTGQRIEAMTRWDPDRSEVVLTLANRGPEAHTLSIRSAHAGASRTLQLAPGARQQVTMPMAKRHRWYDFEVATADGAELLRLAGHVENGRHDISEPVPASA
jgi:phospholipase C